MSMTNEPTYVWGKIDSMVIYTDVALSQADMKLLYEQTRHNYQGQGIGLGHIVGFTLIVSLLVTAALTRWRVS
jgi:hypothetical protein